MLITRCVCHKRTASAQHYPASEIKIKRKSCAENLSRLFANLFKFALTILFQIC